ncbi:MAG: Hsp20/alpha crystallin family protein, partial [Nitrosopumilus sp.]|nr:Hsp20/alpha crystallin family protein [Nitrosopumilus sp.]
MTKTNQNKFEIRIIQPSINSLFSDDMNGQFLSPLSCLREFGTYWLLEFDLPLVNKKDIKVTYNENSISIEAKLKETYYEQKLGVQTKFQYFKKIVTLPNNINKNKTTAKFENGRLKIIIPKKISGQ